MNKDLFKTSRGKAADAINRAGAGSFRYDPETLAAVLAMTATFPEAAHPHHSAGAEQLGVFLEALSATEPEYAARLAIHARKEGKMKDAPGVAVLSLLKRKLDDGRDADAHALGERIFPEVVDTPARFRNAVQVVRSGVLGTRSFGSRLKRVFTKRLFDFGIPYLARRGLVGNKPSLEDVIKILHPNPPSPAWDAFFAYVIGREADLSLLPEFLREYEAFKADPENAPLPRGIEIRQLMGMLPERPGRWAELADRMSWTQLVKNVNTLARHGVFWNEANARSIATRIADEEEMKGSRIFPHSLFIAYKTIEATDFGNERSKATVLGALESALEASLAEVPIPEGDVVIGVDVSGSMGSPVTGYRRGATTAVRCVDVAALFAAATVRRNPSARVIPFSNDAFQVAIRPKDTVMTIADTLASLGGGGTNMPAVMEEVVRLQKEKGVHPDAILFLTDMQTWIGDKRTSSWSPYGSYGPSFPKVNGLLNEARRKAPHPIKAIGWNLAAQETTQTRGPEALNVAGFSPSVWETIVSFVTSDETSERDTVGATDWVDAIRATPLPDEVEARNAD